MEKRVIILAGKKRVGKSTSAQYIQKVVWAANNKNNIRFPYIIGYADPLRNFISGLGFPNTYITGPLKEDQIFDKQIGRHLFGGMTARHLMQDIGTLARHLEPNIFIDSMRLRINTSESQLIIIDDARMPNEIEKFHPSDRVILVRRNMENNDSHETENALDTVPHSKFDLVIDNIGTLDDLYHKLDEFLLKEGLC